MSPHWASSMVSTTLENASSSATITDGSTVALGTSVLDTASLSFSSNRGTPTGWLIYSFFPGGGCTNTAISTDHVTLTSNGSVPNSTATGALPAGSYSFHAYYSGDSNYDPSTSPCEPFTVGTGTTTTSTWLKNATSNATVSVGSTVPSGTSIYDTSSVVTANATTFQPTGMVTYNFFHNSNCMGTASTTQSVTLNSNGSVPNSNATGSLTASGSYAFDAVYSGDSNYTGGTSSCENFSVGPAYSTTVSTALTNASGNTTITVGSTVPSGTSVYDTSTVSHTSGSATPTGSVVYNFFTNGTCTGTPTTQMVTLNSNGSVPNSSATSALTAGSYAFDAVYSGDTVYSGNTSSCENFTVAAPAISTTTATVLKNNASGNATITVGSTVPTGTAVFDTSTVSHTTGSATPTGTVVYNFFDNSGCTGTPATNQTVTLSSGNVPNSNATAALSAGSYAFDAVYSGDTSYSGSTSSCENFVVGASTISTTTATVLKNNASGNATITVGSTVPTGTAVFDTSTVSHTTGSATPTGTVVYNFFDNSGCTGTPATNQTVTLSSGNVPNSNATAALSAGSYAFDAVYSGDTSYSGSTSSCENFVVGAPTPVSTTTSTSLKNSSGNTTISVGSSVPAGTALYDTSMVTPSSGSATPSGTVVYNFFDNSACTGTPASNQTVTLSSGGVPNSNATAALSIGSYAFDAVYSGDTNYMGSMSSCEYFTVVGSGGTPTTITTTVFDASTNAAWSGTEVAGASAYDTATLSGQVGSKVPTGTVTYDFFYTADCTATPFSNSMVTLSGGSVPNSKPTGALGEGSYAFEAVYSGDSTYAGSTSPCEPFNVGLQPLTKVQLYVMPAVDGGTDSGNNCTLKAKPCATIAHALSEEATMSNGAVGSVINLAKGTYNDPTDAMFSGLQEGNDNVTVTGVGKKTVVIPQACPDLGQATVGPDAGSFAMAVFENQPTGPNQGDVLEGVTIENMVLNGANVAACPNYKAGILATNGDNGDALVGVNLESGAPYGILMDDNANTNVISDMLVPVLCTGKVKGPNTGLNAGWTSPANLKVTKVPKCAQFVESGSTGFTGVFINGIAYCATSSATGKVLVLTGTPSNGSCANPTPITSGSVEIQKGASVVYNTSVAPFLQVGIACNALDQSSWDTDCAISDTTVTAGGTVYANQPIGILVTGTATANLDGDTVTGLTDLKGDGIGVGLLPNHTQGQTAGNVTVGKNLVANSGNPDTINSNDNSLVAQACFTVSATCNSTPTSSANWAINGNTVGANDVGIVVEGVVTGADLGGVNLSSNTVNNVATGVGLWLEGDTQPTAGTTCTSTTAFCVGGNLPSLGNTISGNYIGLDLNDGTSNMTVENNTINNNLLFGVSLAGENAFPELDVLGGTTATTGNSFSNNTWTGNGAASAGVISGGTNLIDFNAFCGQSGSPCNNPSGGGSAPTLGTSSPACLSLQTSIPAGFGKTAGTISLENKCTVTPEALGPGTLLIVTGYVNAKGDQVSLFVTQLVSVGTAATSVSVSPFIPAQGTNPNIVPGGSSVAVTANNQPGFSTNPTSSNVYANNNSCSPTAPNTSVNLTLGTGGGTPGTAAGGETGYDAC